MGRVVRNKKKNKLKKKERGKVCGGILLFSRKNYAGGGRGRPEHDNWHTELLLAVERERERMLEVQLRAT